MIAHVQFRRGIPVNEGSFNAYRALDERGWEVRSFEKVDDVVLDPNEPVIGGLDPVFTALSRLDSMPIDIDYPEPLRPFLLDPEVETRTMGSARTCRERWPIFVKPTMGRKEFTGLVLRDTADLLGVTNADDQLPVFVSKPVDLRNRVEWRAFIVDGVVRDVRPYSACPDGQAPARLFVQMLANQWQAIPAGCTIDVVNLGDAKAPDWRVVECNDGYALGSYGLFRGSYAELLVKRWNELTGGTVPWS